MPREITLFSVTLLSVANSWLPLTASVEPVAIEPASTLVTFLPPALTPPDLVTLGPFKIVRPSLDRVAAPAPVMLPNGPLTKLRRVLFRLALELPIPNAPGLTTEIPVLLSVVTRSSAPFPPVFMLPSVPKSMSLASLTDKVSVPSAVTLMFVVAELDATVLPPLTLSV